MIVSVCVDTVARAPRWRRLGFNDCKGSGFGVKHQTAKGKVASHAQPQAPEPQACPAPAIPEHPASPTPFESQTLHPAKAIFGRIFAPVCLSSHRKRPSCPKHPERPPSHPAPNARASASSFATCESHFRAHICARLQFQAASPMGRLQLQAACLCQPAWSACVSP